jgi:hypothetical protein
MTSGGVVRRLGRRGRFPRAADSIARDESFGNLAGSEVAVKAEKAILAFREEESLWLDRRFPNAFEKFACDR